MPLPMSLPDLLQHLVCAEDCPVAFVNKTKFKRYERCPGVSSWLRPAAVFLMCVINA